MNLKKICQKQPFLTLALLTGLSAFDAQANHATQCGLFIGNNCEIEIYSMQLCNKVTFNSGECEKLCEIQKPICNAEGFAPWVEAFQKKGKKQIAGPLVSQGEEFDGNGVLAYTSEKTLSVCRKELAVLRTGSWQKITQATCPKSDVASPDSCGAGTAYDATSKTCEVVDASGDSDGTDYNNLVNHSQLLTNVQNQHFGTDAQIDPNAFQSAATGTQMPGLIDPSKVKSPASGDGSDLSFDKKTLVNKGGKGGSSLVGSSGSALTGGSLGTGSTFGKDAATASTDSLIATANLGNSGSGYGSAGGGVGHGANGEGSGTSWFGSGGSAATAGGASGELAFGKDGKASEDGATRGLASSDDILKIEDPANYFMMSDIEVSLFKRVTAVCRKKEKTLVLAP